MKKAMLVGVCTFAVLPFLMAVEKKGGSAEKKEASGCCAGGMTAAGKDQTAGCCSKGGVAGGTVACAMAQACMKAATGQQVTCPVSGRPVNADVSTVYEGQKVQFCGKGCAEKFKAAPLQYMPAVYKQIYPQAVQVKCPVMGGKVDPKVSIEYKGQQVQFCCKGCDKKFQANPEKYTGKLAEVFTEQVHCPVSGHAIDPKVSIEEKGKKVYFCCAGCIDPYKADPSKYAAALKPTAGLVAYGPTAADDLVLCALCLSDGPHKRGGLKAVEHGGVNYWLCSGDSASTLQGDWGKYTSALRDEVVKRAGGPDKVYTCSMHPDVVRTAAGKCPICGMNLAAIKPAM